MLFDTHFLNSIFPRIHDEANKENSILSVTTDSRVQNSHSLFIPIIGENFDGHDFLNQAVENGAVACLWCKEKRLPEGLPGNFMIYTVGDTTEALQFLASKYREHVNPKVVAVTGSNGKTTTKDILLSVLQTKYSTHATKGNFNNEIGLPLTILSMPVNTEVLVVELGMDTFGEISLLSQITKPDIAVITNIGESHIEFLGSREGIARAKLEITEGINENGVIIIDGDEPLLNKDYNNLRKITCGFDEGNDYYISNVTMKELSTYFTINEDRNFTIPLLGEHHAKNTALAIVVAEFLQINDHQVSQSLQSLKQTAMRFQTIIGKNDVTIVNDAYNASTTSMKAAIKLVKNMTSFKCKILVLGDILELGNYSKQLHLSVAEEISSPINIVFTFGKEATTIYEYIKLNKPMIKSAHFQDKQMIVNELKKHFNKDTIILFKASRGLAFEQMVEQCLVNND